MKIIHVQLIVSTIPSIDDFTDAAFKAKKVTSTFTPLKNTLTNYGII